MNDLFQADKDVIAIERIKAFCPPEGYYVAFSGGKDSVVILDLVKRSGVPFDAHYNITGIDPPELYYFIRDEFPEVQRHRPTKTMWTLIVEERIPPTRTARYCCKYLKEQVGIGRRIVTGIRWQESNRRSNRKMLEPCFRDEHTFYLHPIIDWKDTDVWNYIKDNGIKYSMLYHKGFRRIGCIGCPQNTRRKLELSKWPRYRNLYMKAFDRCLKKRIADGLPTTWESAEAMFEWWISDHRTKQDPDQTVMFE